MAPMYRACLAVTVAVLGVLQVTSSSAFAFAPPIRSTCSRSSSFYTSAALRQPTDKGLSSILAVLQQRQQPAASMERLTLMLSKEDDNTEKSGVEPKYLVALGIFILAALYDFFVTHNGMKDGWVI